MHRHTQNIKSRMVLKVKKQNQLILFVMCYKEEAWRKMTAFDWTKLLTDVNIRHKPGQNQCSQVAGCTLRGLKGKSEALHLLYTIVHVCLQQTLFSILERSHCSAFSMLLLPKSMNTIFASVKQSRGFGSWGVGGMVGAKNRKQGK